MIQLIGSAKDASKNAVLSSSANRQFFSMTIAGTLTNVAAPPQYS